MLANIDVGGMSIIEHLAGYLEPAGRLMGMDGFILLAFILGLPANEIVIPTLMMSYWGRRSNGTGQSVSNGRTSCGSGWTWLTALNVMVFSVLHFPCGTTLLTIKHEAGGWKWTAAAAALTTGTACLACILLTQAVRILRLLFLL